MATTSRQEGASSPLTGRVDELLRLWAGSVCARRSFQRGRLVGALGRRFYVVGNVDFDVALLGRPLAGKQTWAGRTRELSA
jgi:hypothetical protein